MKKGDSKLLIRNLRKMKEQEQQKQALDLSNVMQWVATDKEMPPSGQCVLLYSAKSGVAEGAWISAKGHFEQWRWNAIMTNVTHWMPMPEPPCA